MNRFLVLGTERKVSIPWTVIAPHEGQALINHGQDLETLNRRGGLGWTEMLAVLTDRRHRELDKCIDEHKARELVEKLVVKNVCTVKMLKTDDGHYVPSECCTTTNPTTSGGKSVIDDIDMPCGADCNGDCEKCVIQKILDEYAEITRQAR